MKNGKKKPVSSAPTSRSLLERIRADDTDAWDRLVLLYAPLVYRWCRGRGLREEDVADVVQEVFQAVAAHVGKFRKARPQDTFRGWLHTITRNKIHDRFRRGGREPVAVGGTEAQIALTQLPSKEVFELDIEESEAEFEGADGPDRDLFHRALELIRAEFKPRTWKAFLRTAVDDQSAKEVAEELSMSPGAVRVAKSRVLHRLRAELGDLMEGPQEKKG